MSANWGDHPEFEQRPSRLHRVGLPDQKTIVTSVTDVDAFVEKQQVFKEEWITAARAQHLRHTIYVWLSFTCIVIAIIAEVLYHLQVWPW